MASLKHVFSLSTFDARLTLEGVKLSDASKIFAKKFSCGCSVVKEQVEEIDIQGDFQQEVVAVILKNFKVCCNPDTFFLTLKPHEDRNFR